MTNTLTEQYNAFHVLFDHLYNVCNNMCEFLQNPNCNEDNNPENSTLLIDPCEPGLLFHEFIFLIALIALKSDTNTVDYAEKIENFFRDKLQFDPVPQNADEREPDFDHFLAKAQMRAAGVKPDLMEDENDLYSEDEGEDELDRFEID